MCLLLNKLCYYVCYIVPWAVLLGMPHCVADIKVLDTNSNETVASFLDKTASFGTDFPDDGLMGKIVPALPPEACSDVEPAPGKDVYILLVARGGQECSFVEKALRAQRANYSAIIVHNYEGDDDLVEMGGNGGKVRIPATFVGYRDGMTLNISYHYRTEYVIEILEPSSILPDFLVWPFVLVVGICFMVGVAYMIIKICRDHIKKKGSRLSSRNLKKIPVRKFKKGDYYDTCAICLDEYEEGEKIRVLPCDHVYHTKCIDPWLTKNKKTCPVCKRRVIPGKDADSESSDSDDGGTTARAENTPLLQGNAARQYAYRGTTRFPRHAGTSNPSADDDEATPNASQEDGSGAGSRSTVPTDRGATAVSDSEADAGAVGGVSISDQQSSKSSSSRQSKRESASKEKRENRAERKRKRPEKERLLRQAGERNDTDTVTADEEPAAGTSIQVDETREERRERRRRKKEEKKASKKSSQSRETTPRTDERDVEAGARPEPDGVTDPRSSAGEEQGASQVVVSDGQELRLPTRGRRFELNEVV